MASRHRALPRLFLGSSTEALEIAKYLQESVKPYCQPTIWHQGVFTIGRFTAQTLLKATEEYEFAVLLLTPDDVVTKREVAHEGPRDNVLFELGLFAGAFGLGRTFIVQDDSVSILSDLVGLGTARYTRPRSDHGWLPALNSAALDIKAAIAQAPPLERKELAKLRRELAKLRKEVEMLTANLKSTTIERDALRQANVQLKRHLPDLRAEVEGLKSGEPLVLTQPKPQLEKPEEPHQPTGLGSSHMVQDILVRATSQRFVGNLNWPLPDAEIVIDLSNVGGPAAHDIHGWVYLDANLLKPYNENPSLIRSPNAPTGWHYETDFEGRTLELLPIAQLYSSKSLPLGTYERWRLPVFIEAVGMGEIRYRFVCDEGAEVKGVVPLVVQQSD